MLKNILAITGKPGLYKLVSRGTNMLIVESLVDGKRCVERCVDVHQCRRCTFERSADQCRQERGIERSGVRTEESEQCGVAGLV